VLFCDAPPPQGDLRVVALGLMAKPGFAMMSMPAAHGSCGGRLNAPRIWPCRTASCRPCSAAHQRSCSCCWYRGNASLGALFTCRGAQTISDDLDGADDMHAHQGEVSLMVLPVGSICCRLPYRSAPDR